MLGNCLFGAGMLNTGNFCNKFLSSAGTADLDQLGLGGGRWQHVVLAQI